MNTFHEEEKLAKTYDSRLMMRLLSYAKPYLALIMGCIVLLAFIAATDLAQPYLFKVAIDDHLNYSTKTYDLHDTARQHFDVTATDKTLTIYQEDGVRYHLSTEGRQFPLSDEAVTYLRQQDYRAIMQLALLLVFIFIAGFIMNFLQVYLLNYASNRIIMSIRQELFDHLQHMSLGYFDRQPVGRLVTRITNDTETLHEMYTSVLVNLFKDVFLLVGIVIIMVRLNLQLALVSFSLIPFVLLATWFFRSRVRDAYREVRTRLARINTSLNENLSGVRTIHVFAREAQQFQSFDDLNHEHLIANEKENRISSVFRPAVEMIGSLALAAVVYFGSRQVISGTIEFGILFAFISYIRQFFQPISNLTDKYNILQSAMASSERIFQLLDRAPDIKDHSEALTPANLKGHITFDHVWFAYQEEDWILKDISFNIHPGESVAFVGATGAGKTSLIHLLARFYDIQKGSISIDGIDLRNIKQSALRREIGIVLQDVFLFSGTIAENISLYLPDISRKQIEQAAKEVNAHDFISKLPNGYDEPVMERGNNFSTGQQQLISFARTLVASPSILVLDEATAHIDAETEGLIQQAIPRLMAGRTTIAIAHRLSTIQHCDRIIVLHQGEIVEMGNHQDLLKKRGYYYRLYRLQYQENNSA
ncbi:ABC transporter ATP-binding protein [Anoxynatronum sibiricum]|uniref:ABC transporter ATP-binding protein n=1 Tax=Anoxynatronum sibiricum TaxID=210623 RepID=A0ABU9VRH0_9CLOT